VVTQHPMISIQALSLRVGAFTLQQVGLQVQRGEYCILLGPTGCGKTLLVETICGLNVPDSGTIHLDGRDVTSADPARRGIGYVPQDYALLPFKTVEQNVAFGLQARGLPKAEIRRRLRPIFETLDIGHLRDRFPARLSGGERQRVALGRALAIKPDLLVLDEPLSSLDEGTCRDLMGRLKEIHSRLKTTFLHICHRVEEALTLGDTLAVMRDGRIEQKGPSGELFSNPKNLFIANFLQLPNLLEGEIRKMPAGNLFQIRDTAVKPTDLPAGSACAVVPLHELTLSTRPPTAEDGYVVLRDRIAANRKGPQQPGLRLKENVRLFIAGLFPEDAWPAGQEVFLRFPCSQLHLLQE
jgi:ABC-type sugar transport system ATPase subunit